MADTVRGYLTQLPSGALVYVGRDTAKGEDSDYYIGFRNVGNVDTKLVLSQEAVAALRESLDRPLPTELDEEFPHKIEWEFVNLEADWRQG